jgi:hypothetical protein
MEATAFFIRFYNLEVWLQNDDKLLIKWTIPSQSTTKVLTGSASGFSANELKEGRVA